MVIQLHCPNFPLKPALFHQEPLVVFLCPHQGFWGVRGLCHILPLPRTWFYQLCSFPSLMPYSYLRHTSTPPYNCFCSDSREAHESNFPRIIFYQTPLQTEQQLWQWGTIICIHFPVPSARRAGPSITQHTCPGGPRGTQRRTATPSAGLTATLSCSLSTPCKAGSGAEPGDQNIFLSW